MALPRFRPTAVPIAGEGDAIATKPDLPIFPFASREAWRTLLEGQHATSKRGCGSRSPRRVREWGGVTYHQAVEVALCYGWIDGRVPKFDEDYYLQRFTPRRSRSKWWKVNRLRATELIEQGDVKAAGLREVERAKADGRWDAAYDSPRTATVPEDLQRELERDRQAGRVLL